MTFAAPVRRVLVALVAALLLLSLLPVDRVFADEIAPEVKGETLGSLEAESSTEDSAGPSGSDEASAPTEGSATTDEDEPSAGESPDSGSDAPQEAPSKSSEDEAERRDDSGNDSPAEGDEPVEGPGDAEAEDAEVLSPVRERSEPTEAPFPFTGLGFSGPGTDAPEVYWRALGPDGVWSDWHREEALDLEDGPDPGTLEETRAEDRERRWFTDAVWVGEATHLQVEVVGAALSDIDVTVMDSAGLSESLWERISRRARSLTTAEPVQASPSQPQIVTRQQWGANRSYESGSISYAQPKFGVVHHTVSSNSYSRDEAPQQVRNIYYWHAVGLGWYDMGYNFLIDKYGTIYEGRRGGIDRGVVGAHAGGWNTGSFGVALMGNHNTLQPSTASLSSLSSLIAWKFSIHDIDPARNATVRHNGQTIPTLVGHRNLRGSYTANPSTTTDCPGQLLYQRMSDIRRSVETAGASISIETGWEPVIGDWNGDGRDTVGWYRDGRWRLATSNSSNASVIRVSYGRAGDVPVVGDWNGDGRTTLGVVRDGTWHLKNSLTGGASDIRFGYGRVSHGDIPLAGDWNGDGRDTPVVIRDGVWHVKFSQSSGASDLAFNYGRVRHGDIPVVGDWNGDGRDKIGILRDGEWHLRHSLSSGPGETVFTYGRVAHGDLPIVGDWNRSGRQTVGVVRESTWYLRNQLRGGAADIVFVVG